MLGHLYVVLYHLYQAQAFLNVVWPSANTRFAAKIATKPFVTYIFYGNFTPF